MLCTIYSTACHVTDTGECCVRCTIQPAMLQTLENNALYDLQHSLPCYRHWRTMLCTIYNTACHVTDTGECCVRTLTQPAMLQTLIRSTAQPAMLQTLENNALYGLQHSLPCYRHWRTILRTIYSTACHVTDTGEQRFVRSTAQPAMLQTLENNALYGLQHSLPCYRHWRMLCTIYSTACHVTDTGEQCFVRSTTQPAMLQTLENVVYDLQHSLPCFRHWRTMLCTVYNTACHATDTGECCVQSTAQSAMLQTLENNALYGLQHSLPCYRHWRMLCTVYRTVCHVTDTGECCVRSTAQPAMFQTLENNAAYDLQHSLPCYRHWRTMLCTIYSTACHVSDTGEQCCVRSTAQPVMFQTLENNALYDLQHSLSCFRHWRTMLCTIYSTACHVSDTGEQCFVRSTAQPAMLQKLENNAVPFTIYNTACHVTVT